MVEYLKHIVCTKDTCTFLHRTFRDVVDSIMKYGLYTGAGDLSSTATWQGGEVEIAESSYRQTHKGSNSVVVLNFPRQLWISATEKQGRWGEVIDPRIGYSAPT